MYDDFHHEHTKVFNMYLMVPKKIMIMIIFYDYDVIKGMKEMEK